MRYSSFPGCINVEKTSEQYFRPPLPLKNQKAMGEETETQVPSRMVDKWTVGSNKEGLYNGVKPPEERTREKKKEHQGRVTVASGRTPSETTILSKNLSLGHYLKQPIHPKLAPRTRDHHLLVCFILLG